MGKNSQEKQTLDCKLDKIINLLQLLVATELYRDGVAKSEIGKQLHLAKASVVAMLKGIKLKE